MIKVEHIKSLVGILQKQHLDAYSKEIPGNSKDKKLANLTLAIQILKEMQAHSISFEEAWNSYISQSNQNEGGNE